MVVIVYFEQSCCFYLIARVLECLFRGRKCFLVISQVYLQTGTIHSSQLRCHQVFCCW